MHPRFPGKALIAAGGSKEPGSITMRIVFEELEYN
jgi:hypothetical protein